MLSQPNLISPTIQLSRNQLLSWLNTLTNSNITKIQQLGSGSVYCQLLQLLYPHTKVIPLSKVNFKAKNQYEYINNFKILQQCFNKLNITKYIEVQKLIKCKYQDNLEFLQWFKKMFDQAGKGGIGSNYSNNSHNISVVSAISQADLHLPINNVNNIEKNEKQNKRPLTNSSRTMMNSNSVKDNLSINMISLSTINNSINIQGKVNMNVQQHKKQSIQKSNMPTVTQPSNNLYNNEQWQIQKLNKKKQTTPKQQQYYSPSKFLQQPLRAFSSYFNNQIELQNETIKQYEQQKQFYLKKFKQIEHLLQFWNMQRTSNELAQQIRKILFILPQKKQQKWGIDEQSGQITFYDQKLTQANNVMMERGQQQNLNLSKFKQTQQGINVNKNENSVEGQFQTIQLPKMVQSPSDEQSIKNTLTVPIV